MKARIAKFATIATLTATAVFAPAAVANDEIAATGTGINVDKVADLVRPSIVATETQYSGVIWDSSDNSYVNDGEPFVVSSYCTGFFVSPEGHIGSAAHCFDGDGISEEIIAAGLEWSLENGYWNAEATESVVLDHVNANWQVVNGDDGKIQPGVEAKIFASYSLNGKDTFGETFRARHLGETSTAEGDVAIVKIEASNTPALDLAPDTELEVGAPIVSVGYPEKVGLATGDFSHNPSFKSGSVGSKQVVDGLYSAYELSAPMAAGMSGGPTVDSEGRVVGINSFLADSDSESFTFISPVSELRSVIGAAGFKPELGEMSSLFRAGVTALHAGDRELAVTSLDQVLEIENGHELARDHLAEAKKMEEGGGRGLLLTILGIALLLGAGLGAMKLRSRTGGQQPKAAAAEVATQQPKVTASVLVATAGPLSGERFEVGETLVLGREGGDVVMDDMEVSRCHAELRLENGQLILTDLGSSNGTKLNGAPLDRAEPLVDGDRIDIGASTFVIELGTDVRRGQATVMRPGNGKTVVRNPIV